MRRCLALLLLAAPCHALPLPKLVLDTDIGSDFDDTWALLYLLSRSRPDDPHREFDFALVQCSSFNTTKRALITAKILYDLGRFDVPIAVGLYTGENTMPQFPAVPAGFTLETFVTAGGSVSYGTAALEALMAAATPTAPLFVAEIAPVTSLGGVVRAQPALAANVVVSAMSGSVYHGYGNSSQPEAEYNVYINISAAQAMYGAAWLSPLMTAPLDTSGLVHCMAPEFSNLIAAANDTRHAYAEVLLRNYRVWCGCEPGPDAVSDTLYDAQNAYQMAFAARQWVAPGGPQPVIPGLTFAALNMRVNDTGFTVIDPAGRAVWPTIAFPDGEDADAHVICGNLISYIIAAG